MYRAIQARSKEFIMVEQWGEGGERRSQPPKANECLGAKAAGLKEVWEG